MSLVKNPPRPRSSIGKSLAISKSPVRCLGSSVPAGRGGALGLNLTAAKTYLCLDPTDMRKSFDTLAVLVREHLKGDPRSGSWFVFRGKRVWLFIAQGFAQHVAMSWRWKRSMVCYSCTDKRKGRPTCKAHLTRRATSRLYLLLCAHPYSFSPKATSSFGDSRQQLQSDLPRLMHPCYKFSRMCLPCEPRLSIRLRHISSLVSSYAS